MALTLTSNPTPTYSFPITVDWCKSRIIFSAKAVPFCDAVWMRFDLKCAGSSDVALHINPRFHVGNDTNVVVLNSFLNGCWGAEQRPSIFPFKPNTEFLLELHAGECGFEIFVDNERFADYKYRVDVKTIDLLEVTGYLRLTSIEYLKP